jgi:cytochrome c biogenesis protein ResB
MTHTTRDQIIRIDRLNTARLTCPQCNRDKLLQMSGHPFTKPRAKISFNCPCGYRGAAILEKQPHSDQDIGLAGTFHATGPIGCSGRMSIKQLNSQGITFKTNIEQKIDPGQSLNLEFVLNDVKQSIVKKTVKVLVRDGKYVTAYFVSQDHYDNLGPYLFFNKLYV